MSFVSSKNKICRFIILLAILSLVNSAAFASIASCICGAVCLVSDATKSHGLDVSPCCIRYETQEDTDDNSPGNQSPHCHIPDTPATPTNSSEPGTYQVVSLDTLTWCECDHKSNQLSDQKVVCTNRLVDEFKLFALQFSATPNAIDNSFDVALKLYSEEYSRHLNHSCPSVYQICTLLN